MKLVKRRGQAFETMMLVISVIVAVAILGILLGFIGGIGTFGANAKEVIPELIKKVSQRGTGFEMREKVEFTSGGITAKEAIGQAAVSEGDISFSCSAGTNCGATEKDPIQIETGGKSILVNKKITGTVVVCINDDDGAYHVFVGQKETRTEALKECGLTT